MQERSPDPAPRRRRRRWLGLGLVSVVVAVLAYGGASAVVYDKLSRITEVCSGGRADPTNYTVEGVDTTPYLLPAPVDVQFPARTDTGITIAASWYPVTGSPDAPTVIRVHGFGGCRMGPTDLLTTGMLHRNGIAVLSIDLRDHGDSTKEDMRFAGGTEEYRDVLGAWDWLRAHGVPEPRIGVVGFSLGAATTMIAFGQEQRIAAIWADSSYGDIGTALRDELTRNGYPTLLQPGGVFVGRLISGDDLEAHSPMETTALVNGRPILLTHGLLDQRVSVKNLYELAESIALHGQVAQIWVVPDAHHTEALRIHAAEYEQRMAEFLHGALG